MKKISSTQNSVIKNVQKLHTKKGRTEQNQFIAQGLRVCTTLLHAGYKPTAVFTTEEHLNEIKKLVPISIITLVNNTIFKKLSTVTTPTGLVAVFSIPSQLPAHKLTSGLVLANITDPGNMGTLIRTNAAMNKKSIVLIDGCDPWSPKVVQASAGTIGNVHIFTYSWQELLDNKKELALCALIVKDGLNPKEIPHNNILLIVGNEAHGIPQAWIDDCKYTLTLPMPGKTESLNAAVAGAIALYVLSLPS